MTVAWIYAGGPILPNIVPQPIVIHCESCGHKVTSYEPLPDSIPCPNPICGKDIDLK